jgi:hypothetical protein
MAGRGAEFKDLQPPAEQIDLVDGLRALIATIEHAAANMLPPPCRPIPMFSGRSAMRTLSPDIERVQQRRLASPPVAEVDRRRNSPLRPTRVPVELVGGAGEVGDEQVGRPIVDLVRRPICSSLPSRITPMRSPSTTASAWSWVT